MSTPTHPEPPPHPRFDAPADDITRYRAMSGLAVAGLLTGLASAVAMMGPLGWIVPAVGLACNGLALARIAHAGPALIGRKAALTGLFLSALFATAAPTQWFVGHRLVRNEAIRFAAVWFDALRQGDPYKAQQLTLDPRFRCPKGETYREFYSRYPNWGNELKRYVLQPPVRALLALGPKALVRFYETADQGEQEARPWVQLTYAVTYDDPAEGATTFFITLAMDRFMVAGRPDWRVTRVDGAVHPEGW
ncbi:MAG: hypothetical protein ABR915_07940 [Thermoguttaceae bacterium]|jgi:hypothetical protein